VHAQITTHNNRLLWYRVLCFLQDKFLPFVDLFQKENIKLEVCNNIVRAFTV